MTTLDELIAKRQLTVIYDGECPFCSAYVSLLRLKEAAGPVEALNAREHPGLVSGLAGRGIALDEGMAVIYETRIYAGSDAIHMLSVLSTGSGFFNRLVATAFRNRTAAAVIYPVLRAGRNLTLKLLGRKPIQPQAG